MVRQARDIGAIRGLKLSKECPTLTHLLFADDSLFFMEAEVNSCRRTDPIEFYTYTAVG
ncbi:putative ribonuclease H protein [Corchorus olitorius]|uniref:Ribonuclease H protein n=1 Tax=Corchorus olitorius TaxID=93759 RepID=A0A1R3KLJ1_9ROSI|nr:putative ribonuclease H protein [Corchorus olitorius]